MFHQILEHKCSEQGAIFAAKNISREWRHKQWASSEGILIVQGMDTSKITKGISGFLRQEFRELEILNEITKLRYEGVPMPDVK